MRISRPAGQSVPSVAGCKLSIGGLEDIKMVGTRTSNLLKRFTNPLFICCLVTVGLCVHTAAALPGSGTQQDPWRIQSLADFDEFAADPNYWSGFTRLETDVNLAGRTYSTAVIALDTNNSEDYFQGTAFTGVFDGNNHKITGLTIEGGVNDYLGLFGFISGGEIRKLRLEDVSVSGEYFVGGLVGRNSWGGSISNCYSTGSVSGTSEVGGLVGLNYGTISNCYSTGSVSGDWLVGGLVGGNGGTVVSSYTTACVTGNSHVGGLVGLNGGYYRDWGCFKGMINDCYSTNVVTGVDYVGGLVGYNIGDVNQCYSAGEVTGATNVSGLVVNCCCTGNDGLPIYWGAVNASFWDVQASSQTIGNGDTGKTTAEMQTKSTFTEAGWDFIEIWGIGENQTYPYLRFAPAGDFNYDKKVDLLDLAILASHWLEEN